MLKGGAAWIVQYVLFDLSRSRTIVALGIFYLVSGWGLLFFSEDANQALTSMLSLVLLVSPISGLLLGTIYFHNSREFIELLLAQPMKRSEIYFGHYLGFVFPVAGTFAVGLTAPFLWYAMLDKIELDRSLWMLLAAGTLVSVVFSGLGYMMANIFEDRVRALGISVALWLFLGFVYDGLLLFMAIFLKEYPLEIPVLIMTVLNPLDLARVAVMLNLDTAALMGYTGALFRKFLAADAGTALAMAALLLWMLLPALIGARFFGRRDF